MSILSNPTTQDLAHFAFCALMTLHIAAQDGLVTSPLSEHVFLIRWLATAQKQKRFTRRLAVDIQLLLNFTLQHISRWSLANLFWLALKLLTDPKIVPSDSVASFATPASSPIIEEEECTGSATSYSV